MEAIDVLLRIDRVDDGGRVEARGKRELNEDSVDVGVGESAFTRSSSSACEVVADRRITVPRRPASCAAFSLFLT